jgi:Cu/Zn superoxide dismutase
MAATAFAAKSAPITQGNQLGNVFQAQMPQLNSSSIQGYAAVQANDNGTGLVWDINFSNFPKGEGPFIYHVHEQPVPADGNCTGAGPHLDPEDRGEKPPCDLSQGQKSCQVGDLAGKHGNITKDPFQTFYLDLYTSLTPGSQAFVGNRSVVIHNNKGDRIACGNITQQAVAGSEGSGSFSGSLSSGQNSSSTSASGSSSSGSSSSGSSSSGTGTAKESPSPSAAKQEAAASSSAPSVAKGAASGHRSNAGLALGVGIILAAVL